MFGKNFVRNYLFRGLIAAGIYCITVVIFLMNEKFQSIWVLYLGNALFMLAIALIIFFTNRAQKFKESPVTSAISGHVLSFTGAALSVVLSLLLYFLFSTKPGVEALQQAPSQMRPDTHNDLLFVLIVNAALGNTITGFFAAIFTSFGSSRDKLSEKRS